MEAYLLYLFIYFSLFSFFLFVDFHHSLILYFCLAETTAETTAETKAASWVGSTDDPTDDCWVGSTACLWIPTTAEKPAEAPGATTRLHCGLNRQAILYFIVLN